MILVNINRHGVYWKNTGYFPEFIGRLNSQDKYEGMNHRRTGLSSTVCTMPLEQSRNHTAEIAATGYWILQPTVIVRRSLPHSCFFGLESKFPIGGRMSTSQSLEVERVSGFFSFCSGRQVSPVFSQYSVGNFSNIKRRLRYWTATQHPRTLPPKSKTKTKVHSG